MTFGFYDLYMIVMSYYSSSEPTIGPISMAIKRLCTVLGVGAMVGLVILSILSTCVVIVIVIETLQCSMNRVTEGLLVSQNTIITLTITKLFLPCLAIILVRVFCCSHQYTLVINIHTELGVHHGLQTFFVTRRTLVSSTLRTPSYSVVEFVTF